MNRFSFRFISLWLTMHLFKGCIAVSFTKGDHEWYEMSSGRCEWVAYNTRIDANSPFPLGGKGNMAILAIPRWMTSLSSM